MLRRKKTTRSNAPNKKEEAFPCFVYASVMRSLSFLVGNESRKWEKKEKEITKIKRKASRKKYVRSKEKGTGDGKGKDGSDG